jgi:hypothetical protein
VTCTITTKVVRHKKITHTKCKAMLISGPVKFTITTSARATLTRAGRVFATGRVTNGRLVLRANRALRGGRYTLTLTSHHKTTRQTITIG